MGTDSKRLEGQLMGGPVSQNNSNRSRSTCWTVFAKKLGGVAMSKIAVPRLRPLVVTLVLGAVCATIVWALPPGLWTVLPSLPLPPGTGVQDQTATLLGDGTILIAGGASNPTGSSTVALAAASLYQPSFNSWFALPAMNTARSFHGAALLDPGTSVLVAGGYINNSGVQLIANLGGGGGICGLQEPTGGSPGPTQAAEIFNENTFGWTPVANMNSGRSEFTLVRLANGQVLAPAGSWSDQTAEIYDPTTNSWTYTGGMNAQRIGAATTLLPDHRVLVAGGDFGYNIAGIAINCPTDAEVYDPVTNGWSGAGNMSKNRYHATATVVTVSDGSWRVLVAGGEDGDDGNLPALSTAELWDPASNSFSPAASMNLARAFHTASVLPNGQVLVTGGSGSGGVGISPAEIYDPKIDSWMLVQSMNYPRAGHTATVELGPGPTKVVVAGGSGPGIGGTVLTQTAELFQPTPISSQISVFPTAVLPGTSNESVCAPGLESFVLSSTGIGIPSGQVTFLDSGNPLGTAFLINGEAILNNATLSVGTHSITASYPGDTAFSPSNSSALTQQVVVPPITVSGPSTALQGNPLTLYASVPGGAATNPIAFTWTPPLGTTVTLCNIAVNGCFAGVPPVLGPNVFVVNGTDAKGCNLGQGSFTVNVLTGGVHLIVQVASISRGADIAAVLSATNDGQDTANNVMATASSLNGFATTTALPDSLGILGSASNSSVTLHYPGSAATTGSVVPLRFTITYTDLNTGAGGTISGTLRVTAP
jgi:hypothetical protein